MKYEVTIGGINIEVLKKNHLKNSYIRIIPPEGHVIVSASTICSDEEIRNFVLKKMPEITKVREKFQKQIRQTKREYVSGESHYLWGKPYRLDVVYGNNKYEVEKTPNKIILKIPEGTDINKRESIIMEWYRKELKRALEIISKRCEKNTGLRASEYRVKNMKTRWGTCNIDKKRIWINLQLVKKPMECLAYVLTHELVHLLEKNHTNRFHAFVEEFYPTWKEARKLLSELPLDHIETNDFYKEKDIERCI